ncbi:hypothetical protein V6N11_060116 [Hibiscus sabdariffa]|uniref:RNase H type-1 domain-containing protein n=1 Tax=Hibiscus sabdariffa TaxID=183260 RepID=A0ABR2P2X2_9ROSI
MRQHGGAIFVLVVVRDSVGNLMLGWNGSLPNLVVLNLMLTVLIEASWGQHVSDSCVALGWVTHSCHRPWRLWEVFVEIDEVCAALGDLCFVHTLREANDFPDALAKEGMVLFRCRKYSAPSS